MSILEFLGLRPTLPRFAARLVRAMPAETGEWSFDAERGSLRNPGGTEVSLHNLFLEYASTGVFGRAAMIGKYASLALSQSQQIPDLWVAAAKNIYPVVRSEFVETTLEIRCRATGATLDPLVFALAGDLRIRLVYDFGSYVSYVRAEHLSTWGQPKADVLQRAVANLGRLKKAGWLDSGRGYLRLVSEDSYAESMLQLDSVAGNPGRCRQRCASVAPTAGNRPSRPPASPSSPIACPCNIAPNSTPHSGKSWMPCTKDRDVICSSPTAR